MKQRVTLLLAIIVMSVMAGDGVVAQDATASSVAYDALKIELEEIGKSLQRTRDATERQRMISDMENKLIAFRKDYPETPEAADAAFQLGVMKSQLGEFVQAATYLSEFIIKSSDGDRNMLAFAHYYLAESYKGAGKYEDAKAEYEIVMNDFSGVNPRLIQAAQQSVATLEAEKRLAIGAEPIDFNVKSTEGKTLSPAEFKGKVLLLDFWATWCGPCIQEMPNIKKAYSKYKNEGFEIVGISLDRNRSALDQYVAKNNIGWPQYFDGKYFQNDIAVKYGIKSIPTTYLIDRQGKIRYKSLRGARLEKAIEQLLAEGS